MLTTQSFIVAVCAYGLAALLGLAMIRRLWFQRSASLASSVAMGLIGGLLLTPAYPSSEAASIAPRAHCGDLQRLVWRRDRSGPAAGTVVGGGRSGWCAVGLVESTSTGLY